MNMLKIIPALMIAIVLSSCASTQDTQNSAAANIGMGILKTTIKQACQTQLTNHQYWKIATVAMSEQAKDKISDTACGCVAEKAPESTSISELATAAIDPNARKQIAQKIIINSLQACTVQTLNSLITPS